MSDDRDRQKEMRNRAVAEMMRRADEELLPTLSQKVKLKSPWESYFPTSGENALRLMEASKLRTEADAFFRKRNFKEAKSKYIEGAKLLIGPSNVIPRKPGPSEGGVTNSTYVAFTPTERASLMSLCTGAGKSLWKDLDYDGALQWLQESLVIEENLRDSFPTAMFDWKDYFVDYPPLSTEKFTAMIAMSDVLFELGNTAASLFYIWNAFLSSSSVPPSHVTPDVKALLGTGKVRERAAMRHPDPKRSATIDVKDCRLQVKGSWQKLLIKKKNDLLTRLQFSSFIWEGHLYVLGGQKETGPQFRDMWSLDLEVLDEWRQEASYPSPQSMTGYFEEWSVCVWEDKAYVINGREKVDYFDLKTKKWGYIITTYKTTADDVKAGMDGWPWPGKILTCATMQVYKGKLYVFGGRHSRTRMGCSLFMELDLKEKKWRRLSGYPILKPDKFCPGPRKSSISWVSPGGRFYLFSGEADRQGAYISGEAEGASAGYGLPDFWSWGFEDEKWRRERFAGNAPSPRSEVACCYNPNLDVVILFGGYVPSLPMSDPARSLDQMHRYSYFADTFTYDCDNTVGTATSVAGSPGWKHVITRGFPTYRCGAQLHTDTRSGKTYLFGGLCNTDFIPSCRMSAARPFGDLWQLKLDVLGGYFEGVDMDEESKTARVGPWQRCFNCASAGPWKKCGGSCNGRAFFCGAECLKDGWRAHKETHKCRKK